MKMRVTVEFSDAEVESIKAIFGEGEELWRMGLDACLDMDSSSIRVVGDESATVRGKAQWDFWEQDKRTGKWDSVYGRGLSLPVVAEYRVGEVSISRAGKPVDAVK